MTLPRLLFPQEERKIPGQRWLLILFRSFHLVGICGMAGGFLFTVEPSQWHPFLAMTTVSGCFLCLIHMAGSFSWLLRLKGQVIVAKILLLALLPYLPDWRAEIFVVVIVISGIIAHAPGNVRAFQIGQALRSGPPGRRARSLGGEKKCPVPCGPPDPPDHPR